MNKTNKLIISFLLLYPGCTTKDSLKEEALKLLPSPKNEFLARISHSGDSGIDLNKYDACGHRYLVKEYDYNNNGKIDSYMFYAFNPKERVYGENRILPNLVFSNEDENKNICYVWMFMQKENYYLFQQHNIKDIK